jgi:hypothetical protein
VGRERRDAGHMARSFFVWPRHLQAPRAGCPWPYSRRCGGALFFVEMRSAFARLFQPPALKNAINRDSNGTDIDDLTWWTAALKAARER